MLRKIRNLVAIAAVAIAGLAVATPQAHAEVIKVGTISIVHGLHTYMYQKFAPPGTTVEVIEFPGPMQVKDALVAGQIQFGMFGLAAATIGGAKREPIVIIAAACNKGMGIVVNAKNPAKSVGELQGKKLAVASGSTQEVVINDRLSAEGLSASDVTIVNIPFGAMPAALEKGEVDAFVGAEPGPSISVLAGVGKLIDNPYSTPTGDLNMVLATSPQLIASSPDTVRAMMKIHKQAAEFAAANSKDVVAIGVEKLKLKPEVVEKALTNVGFSWKMDAKVLESARHYARQMKAMNKINDLPDFTALMNMSFNKEIGGG